MTLTFLLIFAALVLSAYDLFTSRGRSILGWAVALMALALTLPQLRGL